MRGGSWVYYTHAGGGGTPSTLISDDKLDFCLIEGTFQAIYDNWPILSDISTVESYAETAAALQQLIYSGAIADIKSYVASGGVTHGPPQYGSNDNTINWYSLDINWLRYGSWDGIGTMTTDDAIPYFAEFLRQQGLGDGTVDLQNDPDPTVDCI